MIKTPELSLVIPLYNEEANVELVASELVTEFEAHKIDYELILVNNGSKDQTPQLIEALVAENPRIKPVHVEVNQGYGWGVLSGLAQSQGRYLGHALGDNQVIASDIVKVFFHLRDHKNLDMCKALRVTRHDGFLRKIVTMTYNLVFLLLFSPSVKDINGCPKIFRREAYNKLSISSKDWFLDPEIVIKATENNLKIGEVPVIYYERLQGSSNVKFRTILEFAVNLLYYRFTGQLYSQVKQQRAEAQEGKANITS